MICPQCNLPRYYGPTGIAAPQCQCVLGYHGPKLAPAPEAPKCQHEGQCHPGFCPCSEAKAQAAGQESPEALDTATAVGELMLRLSQWKATNPHTAPPAWKALVQACRQMVAADEGRVALAQRQPLTDAEVDRLFANIPPSAQQDARSREAFRRLLRVVESAHGIGATTGEPGGPQ